MYLKYSAPIPCEAVNQIKPFEIRYPYKYLGRIESKFDIIIILLELIIYVSQDPQDEISENVIIIDRKSSKTSRVIFFNTIQEKFYTIFFPFSIENDLIYYNTRDNVVTPDVISILKMFFTSICTHENIDKLDESLFMELDEIMDETYLIEPMKRELIKKIAFDLIVTDFSYLRFDIDIINSSENHPEKHFDFFYNKKGQLKIGIKKSITADEFHEILNNERKCYYITPMR